MSREKAKDIYNAKPSIFGNGAKLKAYKKHIGKEMVIMTKDKFEEIKEKKKNSKLVDKIFELDKKVSKKYIKLEK